jgi:hypothetical protein
VYEASQEDVKEDFLRELGKFYRVQRLVILNGGDFNLLKNSDEKKKNQAGLTANLVDNTPGLTTMLFPTSDKLDRFLVHKHWGMLFLSSQFIS